jgi:hypothetical protein
MKVDSTVNAALGQAGINRADLATLLSVDDIGTLPAHDDAGLEPELARAMPGYLNQLPAGSEVGTADLAWAILYSAQNQGGGALPRHLQRLRIDYPAALAALERLGAANPFGPTGAGAGSGSGAGSGKAAGPRPEHEVFSRSVMRVRDRLGGRAVTSAARIAAEIQRDHPEYAQGRFGQATLRVSGGTTAAVEDWLERVRDLYDAQAVVKSRHKVIDGELAVLGLAELDGPLQEDLKAGGLLNFWEQTVEVLPRRTSSDQTGWVHDGLADKDMLGRDYLARTLAMKLSELRDLRSGTSPRGESFMVHIDGPWGSGKSTLFRFLKKQLEATDDYLIIEINAWREQKVGLQWWTLHNALREAVEKDAVRLMAREQSRSAPSPAWISRLDNVVVHATAWIRAKGTSRAHVIQTRLVPFLSAVVVLIVGLFGLTLLANLDLKAGAEMADSIAKIASLLVLGLAGLTAAYRFLLPDSHRPAKDFVSAATNPMVEVRRLFGRTLARTKKSAVFLIDDLDRCEPEYIVDFLSVIQTLVRDARQTVTGPASKAPPPGPYAFVAADGYWIRTSYEAHYNSARPAEVPGRPLGYQFLEKIFQLQVRLPSISEATKQAFYESLLKLQPTSDSTAEGQGNLKEEVLSQVRQATTGEDISRAAAGANRLADPALRLEVLGTAAVRFSESLIQESTRHALAPYGRFLEPNPRNIKLFVNTYNVLRSLRILEGLTSIPIRSLALWAVLEIRWPLLADHLRVHPDDIGFTGNTTPEPPESIRDLLKSAEVKAVIADPAQGLLTPSDVRDCTGRAASRP